MNRIKVHRFWAGFWLFAAIPAFLWWQDAIWFVIAASLFANVYSAWSAAEASDDSKVIGKLTAMQADIKKLKERLGI